MDRSAVTLTRPAEVDPGADQLGFFDQLDIHPPHPPTTIPQPATPNAVGTDKPRGRQGSRVPDVIVFRLAHYKPDGTLRHASHAYPTAEVADPQTVADRCARAAETGCTYRAGTFLVWADPGTEPHQHIEHTPPADGLRSYGHPAPGPH